MANNNRIFVSFAIEDVFYRNGLVNQAKDERTPFEFTDMSVKEPWEDSWKSRLRIPVIVGGDSGSNVGSDSG